MKKIEAIIGIKEIPVILCDEWTPAQVKAFRLMVNRSATWADWDDDLLKLELLDLKTSDFNLALTGFDTKEIDDLILNDAPEEDALPPVPVKPVSCVGDLWICGSHRVLCGDATDPQAVSRLLGERMESASAERHYEEAALCRDQIRALSREIIPDAPNQHLADALIRDRGR